MFQQKLFLSLLIVLIPFCASAERYRYITIGTGSVTGVYYPTGGAISKVVNRKKKKYLLHLTPESTSGSVFNINALTSGDLEFAVVQSDHAYHAAKGLKNWESQGPQTQLQGVFSLYLEAVTLVASQRSGIQECSDLKGKSVSIGSPGSGTRRNAEEALMLCGLDVSDLDEVHEQNSLNAIEMLKQQRIDAFFYTVGHPNGVIKEATSGDEKVRFISLKNLDPFLEEFPYYHSATIHPSFYPRAENTSHVSTFGVKAIFLTSASVPDDVVYAVTKEIFENLSRFQQLHPALSQLSSQEMIEGIPFSLHPGALKYYQEAGLLP